MDAINRLIEADQENPKRIMVVGDCMEDHWVVGEARSCQEECPLISEHDRIRTPGGAANAARQLQHWNSKALLVGLCPTNYLWKDIDTGLCIPFGGLPRKTRFLDKNGRIVFRSDCEGHIPDDWSFQERCRELALQHLRVGKFDAVLISDYNKGFFNKETIQEIIGVCRSQNIPCVADPRRPPDAYFGAILKADCAYLARHAEASGHVPAAVITYGANYPLVFNEDVNSFSSSFKANCPPAPCVNHVGAGDCFAAHLTLALAHGLPLDAATAIAHAAGRVYVQHAYARPPWPHEVRLDLHPTGGKIVQSQALAALRESNSGRMIFTNGFFRLGAHAGHVWMLERARQCGDFLVVGVNDDASSARLRPGEVVLPLAERIAVLAALECVDWVVPFAEDTPTAIMAALKADVLAKGWEYNGEDLPGAEYAKEVVFLPESPFPNHSTQLVELCRINCS